ncbi:MAG: hypothetical protein J7539_08700 [Niabella sp.]|nr:hypothetical protein [Niabella sp.]
MNAKTQLMLKAWLKKRPAIYINAQLRIMLSSYIDRCPGDTVNSSLVKDILAVGELIDVLENYVKKRHSTKLKASKSK